MPAVLSGFFICGGIIMRNNFTEGAILPKLLKFMLPVLFAMFLQSLYGAVDLHCDRAEVRFLHFQNSFSCFFVSGFCHSSA